MGAQVFVDDADLTIDDRIIQADVQGDVLVGLQKRAEIFLFFTLSDSELFKRKLGELIPLIATTRQVRIYEQSHAGDRIKVNIAFTAPGLAKLGKPVPADAGAPKAAFLDDITTRSTTLGDDVTGDWLPAYRAETFDGVLLVAAWDDDPHHALTLARRRADAVVAAFGKDGANTHLMLEAHREEGRANVTQSNGETRFGHEAFGFADGVSQPAVKGLHKPITDDDQSMPGQDLVDVGHFILTAATAPVDWMANGSYLVFRRLRQDVPAFHDYTTHHFNGLAENPAQFAARLIGRWPDGSPLARDPLRANPKHDETVPEENNDFDFGVEKTGQDRCPFNAHIRRVYPRADIQDGSGDSEERRLLRAGIAFDYTASTPGDQGLLFVCYQSSIEDKFEFVQKDWANADHIDFVPPYVTGTPPGAKMPATPGIDLIIGQGTAPRNAQWRTGALTNVPKFVTATGGGYFFSPSITGLKSIAA